MTTEMHPQVAEALRQAQRFQSALEAQLHLTATQTFTATDESETVEVTVNGHRWLTDIRIEDGLLRLGAETAEKRINEAIRAAVAAAAAAGEAESAQLVESLAEIAGSLQGTLGLA
ncbi:YbaB/EbfC family nucleoid-associated protein [Mycobacterium parmense]|uniref:DNA-binding protein n=1 Tax=Mycobacterium parmense TaxID=185642 RepID=A0A7I7YXU6_9MYCO|nr:YbaB/EbfC family nucleoid-associated protein [Mycobacterium parmense]MCV7352737.1 YbaB/EbfC family nucleoid-associated protein [Mycobacterium parmense]ORW54648.1 DNA-binding protein [Mycobacterium parmense]BBZ46745.1 DNA-binding protein [Mycobacterium parmense]